MTHKLHVVKGDRVKVIAGKDKGAVGEVIAVYPDTHRVTVAGVNIVKRHVRDTSAQPQSRQTTKGGIVSQEAPIHASKVMVVDAKADEPTRVKNVLRTEKRDGKTLTFRYRVGKKSGQPLTAKDREYAEKKS